MRPIPARSGQPQSPVSLYSRAARSGYDAGGQWLTDCPDMSAGAYRDSQFAMHACDVGRFHAGEYSCRDGAQ